MYIYIYIYIYISACAVMAHVTKTTKDNECAATVQRKEIYIYMPTPNPYTAINPVATPSLDDLVLAESLVPHTG